MRLILTLLFIILFIGVLQSEEIYTYDQALDDLKSFFSLISNFLNTEA